MTDLRDFIPAEFCSSDETERPYVKTVGELIEELQRVPRGLRLCAGCRLMVHNVSHDPALEIVEVELDDGGEL